MSGRRCERRVVSFVSFSRCELRELLELLERRELRQLRVAQLYANEQRRDSQLWADLDSEGVKSNAMI